MFSWEWTQLEQSASRILRDAGSWYMHYQVYDGYTNKGEVLGAGIGPGSNSQYFSLQKISNNSSKKLVVGVVVVAVVVQKIGFSVGGGSGKLQISPVRFKRSNPIQKIRLITQFSVTSKIQLKLRSN